MLKDSNKKNTGLRYRDIEPVVIEKISLVLLSGGVAVLPTSTIYGLSCKYGNDKAVARIYRIKNRPSEMPFIVLVPDIKTLDSLIREKTVLAEKLINRYWLSAKPDPLTIVFKKNSNFLNSRKTIPVRDSHRSEEEKVVSLVQKDEDTIAVRLDPLPVLKKILKKTGPLISTSANISGSGQQAKKIEEIHEGILKKVDIILDLQTELSGSPSTIIDATAETPVILRQGALTVDFRA
jgi:L-threonylcarbamoyladenylate synthase